MQQTQTKTEPNTIADQRQTSLWQQTIELGRQQRGEAAPTPQESPREQAFQRRQLRL